MDNKLKNRNITLDIAKGIGILFVVLGHCNMQGGKFVSLFHMALFFMISGIFIKAKYSENFQEVINFAKKKICVLGGVFIACNVIFLFLHNFFIDINIYSNNPLFLETTEGQRWGGGHIMLLPELTVKFFWTLLLARGEQLGGATWFLRSLLFASIVFVILKYLQKYLQKFYTISNLQYCSCIIIVSFLLSYVFEKLNFNVYGIGSTCSALAFLCIGHLIKEYKLIKWNIYILIISFIILLSFAFFNVKFSFVLNTYDNIFSFVFCGILGFYFVYSLSKYIETNRLLTNIFSYLGQHTLAILCLHFFAFKLINYIQITVYSYPKYMLAAFPVINAHQGIWCISYLLAGLYIPCLISFLFSNLKNWLILRNKDCKELLKVVISG